MRRSGLLLATPYRFFCLRILSRLDWNRPHTINPDAPATFNVGDPQTYFVTTTGCATSP